MSMVPYRSPLYLPLNVVWYSQLAHAIKPLPRSHRYETNSL